MFDTIEYKGKKYPIRELYVEIPEWDTKTITIATEELKDALDEEGLDEHGSVEDEIDGQIYFYVEHEGILNLPPDELCAKHLDCEIRYIADSEDDV